jgi:hypothetical protein
MRNEFKEDDKAFLFQLHPNQVMLKNTLDDSFKGYALRCQSDSLSGFGWGWSLRIYEPGNEKKSHTNH